jgi:hypothetical protein
MQQQILQQRGYRRQWSTSELLPGAGPGLLHPSYISAPVGRRRAYFNESVSAPEDAGSGADSGVGASYSRGMTMSDSESRDLCPPLLGPAAERRRRQSLLETTTTTKEHAAAGTDLVSAVSGGARSRRRLDSNFRTDSLSSDQSECVQARPPPPRPHKQRRHRLHHEASFASSSDEEVRSTPDYTSCGEEELESESVSEKGTICTSVGEQ